MAWISNYKYALPSSKINFNTVAQNFFQIAKETAEASTTNDVPYFKERMAMMFTILKRFMVQSGASGKYNTFVNFFLSSCGFTSFLKPRVFHQKIREIKHG